MAQHSSSNRYYNRNQEYYYGAEAPARDIPEAVPTPAERENRKHRENRRPEERTDIRHAHRTAAEPATRFNFAGFVLVLASFIFLGIVMVHYVNIRTELNRMVKAVASDEVELTDLQLSNDEFYSRTVNSIDLDEIADKAKNELNMSYASEGQIITYTSAGNDYMRKVDSN